MTSHANNIHWKIPEAQTHLFNKYSLEDPESLIKEGRVIKEGHERGVYFHQAGGFYIKRMRTKKAKKEWQNWIRLFEEGLPTIVPIAMGIAGGLAYLVSVAHDEYAPLNTMFDALDYKARVQVLKRLGEVVYNMHETGFYHGDLHGGNFILRLDKSCPDLKMADFQRGGFKKITDSRRLKNLADLALSHFFRLGVKEQLVFLTGYLGSCQEARAFIRHDGKQLERLILKRSSIVADRKVRKFRKINKYFDRLTLQSSRYRGVYLRKNQHLIPESFLSSPLKFIYGNQVEILKDSRSVRVVRHQDICIKYYKRRSPKDLLKSLLGVSKGKKSFRWSLAMIYRFITTPEPLCYIEGRGGDSFYLSRFVDSACNIVLYMREASEEKQKRCLQALAIFLKKMFYRGVYHMDLKGSNILVRDTDSKFEFYLIDTDEIALFWKGSPALLKNSLLRITRTLVSCFNRQEMVDFVDACLPVLPTRLLSWTPEDLVDQAFKIQHKITITTQSCPLCKNTQKEFFVRAYDRLVPRQENFNYVRCASCSLVYLDPVPVDVGRYYPEDYSCHAAYPKKKQSPINRLAIRYHFSVDKPEGGALIRFLFSQLSCVVMKRTLSPFGENRLLDVGCGGGKFLYRHQQLGWHVRGIDFSQNACETCWQQGLKVHHGDVFSADYDKASFDVITLRQVIEHVPDPVGILRKTAEFLAPGGKILVSTPNIESLGFLLFGNCWYPLEAPRHLVLFSPKTIRRLAEMAGLRAKQIFMLVQPRYFDKSLQYIMGQGRILPEDFLERKQIFAKQKKGRRKRLHYIASPLTRIACWFGKGEGMEVELVKGSKKG